MKKVTFSGIVVSLSILVAVACAQEAAGAGEGESIYNANCASCHQATGQGVPGAFPPLAGHVPDILAAEGGRDYLVNVLLYGLQGEIQVQGQTYNGVMPAWQQLSDQQLADVLTYISTAWENTPPEGFEPFSPDQVAAQRDASLSAQQVYERRQELGITDAQ